MAQYLLTFTNVKPLDMDVHNVDSSCPLGRLPPSQDAPVFITTRSSAQVNLLRGLSEDGIQPREKFSSVAFRHVDEPMQQAAGHLNARQDVASQGLKE
jgi:hypothetical protein